MDADAYLRRHGWRGTGHSLDHTDRGIKKPLLISHKQDQLGLGKKKAAHTADDQWWMRAFDESLKNIGSGSGVESTLSQVRKTGINRGGLYGFFVKGEGLAGTMFDTLEVSSTDASTAQSSASASRAATPPAVSAKPTKRKREGESEEDRKRRKEEKKSKDCKKKEEKKEKKAKKDAKKNKDEKKAVTWAPEVTEKAAPVVPETKATPIAIDPAAEKKVAIALTRINREVAKTIKKMEKGEQNTQISPQKKAEGMGAVKAELKKQMVVDAMLKGDLPNPNNYTSRQQALDNYETDLENKRNGVQSKPVETATPIPVAEVQIEKIEETTTTTLSSAEEKERKIIAAKIIKLTVLEKTQYEERAKAKNQTLEQYILRRAEKKGEKSEKKQTKSTKQ